MKSIVDKNGVDQIMFMIISSLMTAVFVASLLGLFSHVKEFQMSTLLVVSAVMACRTLAASWMRVVSVAAITAHCTPLIRIAGVATVVACPLAIISLTSAASV